ncbi:hypothetical protein Pcaca04_13610 [Pectobacterium carotovorum subsp. carotovorum]|nr:hypothetical protein Pcaca04_13610 [Pectobacterium carotovorum subsp. carotovorum]
MQTNAQNTLVMLFQHVDIFFTMLDYHASRHKSVVGFSISSYEATLTSYVEHQVADPNDRRRIISALSIRNLNKCGLLSFINDSKGLFSLQKGLLQTIQNLDSRRIRELGQPDLDIIYAQVRTLYDYFLSKQGAFGHDDPEFLENLAALTDTMQDIFSKIDHNVRALDGSSKRLSEIVDSHDFNQQVPTEQVQKALDEIIRIYRRNIKPTLTFLNEKAMANDASAMYLIRKIRESLEKTTFYKELNNIVTIEMKLLSYVEVINLIRKKLRRYVDMSIAQRKLYDNIEIQFNEINQLVLELLDTRLKGKQLSLGHPIFTPSSIFSGLQSWSRTNLTAPLIELPADFGAGMALEYIRTKLNRADMLGTAKRRSSANPHAKESYLRRKHVMRIKKAMASFEDTNAVPDLYLAIHQHLCRTLPEYGLKDIYDALPFVSKRLFKKQTLERREIRYGTKVLSYTVKRLEVNTHE